MPRRLVDIPTARARRFVDAQCRAERSNCTARLWQEHAEAAWQIFRQPATCGTRQLVECLLLAGCSDDEIAREIGSDPLVLANFESWFFDVRSRISAPGAIYCVVLESGIPSSEEGRKALAIRRYAYAGGTEVAKSLLYGCQFDVQKPRSGADLNGYFRQTTRASLASAAALAVHLLDPGSSKHTKVILQNYIMLQRIDSRTSRKQGEQPFDREAFKKGYAALKKYLPWANQSSEASPSHYSAAHA